MVLGLKRRKKKVDFKADGIPREDFEEEEELPQNVESLQQVVPQPVVSNVVETPQPIQDVVVEETPEEVQEESQEEEFTEEALKTILADHEVRLKKIEYHLRLA